MAGVCLSVCLSVACLDLTREWKGLPRNLKIGRMEAWVIRGQKVKGQMSMSPERLIQCLFAGRGITVSFLKLACFCFMCIGLHVYMCFVCFSQL